MKHFWLTTAFLSFACFAALAAAAQNFAPPVTLPVNAPYSPPDSLHIALADFNNDGLLDLIYAYPGYMGNRGGGGGVQISSGDGKGGFATPLYNNPLNRSQYYSGSTDGPLYLTLGDFNNDGRLDVVCPLSGGIILGSGSSYGTPFDGTTIGVLFGNSAGTRNGYAFFTVGDTPTAALVADFNHDNIPDVAVTNASGILTVYLGIGGGLYQGGAVYRVGGNPKAIRIGDFNHDGRPDLATVNTSDGSISILLNKGNGAFQKAKRFVIGANLQDVALADLNVDGRTDIVALRTGEIDVFLSNSDGSFTLSKTYPTSTSNTYFDNTYPAASAATALLLADLSGNGKLDAIANNGVVTRGIGSAAGNTALLTYSGNLAVGDVNGDGKLDFVIGNQLYLNLGPNSSSAFSLIVNVTPEGIAAAPINSNMYGRLALRGPDGLATDISFTGKFAYSFANLPANGCSLRITCPDYLTVDISLNGSGGATQYLNITLPAGDANGDNSVDSTDFGILIGAYGGLLSVPGSGYDSHADFNHDGSVDSTDFGLLIGNYGRQGDL